MTAGAAQVDVVVPVWNLNRFLPEAVSSVVGQEGVRTRVTVVDDGGDDDPREVLGEFDPQQVRVVRRDAHGGIAAARNSGLAATAADPAPWLAFLDADDVWVPGALALVLAQASAVPGAVVAGTSVDFDGGAGGAHRVDETPVPAFRSGGVLVRRADADRVGRFDESVQLGEFVDWLDRARGAGLRLVGTDVPLLRRRIHGANTTVRDRHRQDDYLTVVRLHLARSRGRR